MRTCPLIVPSKLLKSQRRSGDLILAKDSIPNGNVKTRIGTQDTGDLGESWNDKTLAEIKWRTEPYEIAFPRLGCSQGVSQRSFDSVWRRLSHPIAHTRATLGRPLSIH